MKPVVTTFFHEPTFTATHVVREPDGPAAAIVDPVLDYDPAAGRTATRAADDVLAYVRERGLAVEWILETHAHADHLTAAAYLKRELGAKVAIGAEIGRVQKTFAGVFNFEAGFPTDGRQFDRLLAEGDTFRIGKLEGRAMHTPGHTPACMTYTIGDAAFVGDTLFMPDYGTARCDFPGGDAATLFRSIRRVLALPPATRLFLCHDYKAPGRDRFVWETTVADERAHNIHVHDGIAEADFVALRKKRDSGLGMPNLLLPSIQVNVRAGNLPPPEANGTAYLKIPLNLL
ncbi:MAG: MBL fold metallo-hydrolase [Rhodospirillaceae bacterium]|nr:MBL fold metallo-hydrolase [Rhodospirillaceae bacterium]